MRISKIIVAIFLIFMVGLAFYLGTVYNRLEASSSPKIIGSKIALVNNDQSMIVEEEKYNFGDVSVNLIMEDEDFSNYQFEKTSQSEALQGLENNNYSAIITIPANFTKSILSVDEVTPESTQIVYKINGEMSESKQKDYQEATIKMIDKVRESLMYMYIYETFEELHYTQNGIDKVIDNMESVYDYSDEVGDVNLFANHDYNFEEISDKEIQGVDLSEEADAYEQVVASYTEAIEEQIKIMKEENEETKVLIDESGEKITDTNGEIKENVDNVKRVTRATSETMFGYAEEDYNLVNIETNSNNLALDLINLYTNVNTETAQASVVVNNASSAESDYLAYSKDFEKSLFKKNYESYIKKKNEYYTAMEKAEECADNNAETLIRKDETDEKCSKEFTNLEKKADVYFKYYDDMNEQKKSYNELIATKTNPQKDTDNDGIDDRAELIRKTDPEKEDTDGDGVKDGQEVEKGTDPLSIDTDMDGLTDKEEEENYPKTDPLKADTDGDGISDGLEKNAYKTDPLRKDTDNDSISDFDEIYEYRLDPLDSNSNYLTDTDGDGKPNVIDNTPLVTDQIVGVVSQKNKIQEQEEKNNPFNSKTLAKYLGTELTAEEVAGLDTDGDGLSDIDEELAGTDVNNPDSDSDGINDGQEVANNLDPLNSADAQNDNDNDGLTNQEEITKGTNLNEADTDADGINDGAEVANNLDPLNSADAQNDNDNDGLTNQEEININTDLNNPDSDGDSLTDGDEVNNGTNPLNKDTDGDGKNDDTDLTPTDPDPNDLDSDGLSDADEKAAGTDLTNPDTDGDGINDGDEVNKRKTDPLKADSDGDGINDGAEVANGLNPNDDSDARKDYDNDGLSNRVEITGSRGYITNPRKADTDGDGIKDGDEINGFEAIDGEKYRTDPTKADTDDDGLTDKDEMQKHRTNPKKADTDKDGLKDGEEVNVFGSDPLDEDTDKDGYIDGIDPQPCIVTVAGEEFPAPVTIISETKTYIQEDKKIDQKVQEAKKELNDFQNVMDKYNINKKSFQKLINSILYDTNSLSVTNSKLDKDVTTPNEQLDAMKKQISTFGLGYESSGDDDPQIDYSTLQEVRIDGNKVVLNEYCTSQPSNVEELCKLFKINNKVLTDEITIKNQYLSLAKKITPTQNKALNEDLYQLGFEKIDNSIDNTNPNSIAYTLNGYNLCLNTIITETNSSSCTASTQIGVSGIYDLINDQPNQLATLNTHIDTASNNEVDAVDKTPYNENMALIEETMNGLIDYAAAENEEIYSEKVSGYDENQNIISDYINDVQNDETYKDVTTAFLDDESKRQSESKDTLDNTENLLSNTTFNGLANKSVYNHMVKPFNILEENELTTGNESTNSSNRQLIFILILLAIIIIIIAIFRIIKKD